jgi:two-component system sensor histidine kinase FlrB
MSAEVSSRVFEPFFTTKPHGHGLGLAAVQGLVHSMGGEITVHSVPGEGTTFRVRLPVA